MNMFSVCKLITNAWHAEHPVKKDEDKEEEEEEEEGEDLPLPATQSVKWVVKVTTDQGIL